LEKQKFLDYFGDDRLHPALAILVLITTFLIYNATKAPTLSFWDCGEFIACSYILGIPHPPGTPLYILIGRLFSITPFHADVSANVNMFSVISGAFAAMFAYLIIFKLIRMWSPRERFTGWIKASAYIGALVGASMFAFGRTHWNNSMEAEVYTPSMLLLMIIFWVFLRWYEQRDEPRGDRYLLLIMFLAFLSIGIHMTVFLFMPAIFLMVILFSERLRKDYRFYITCALLFLISASIDLFFDNSFFILNGIWFLVLLGGAISTRHYAWRFSILLFLAAAIGFSCQLYTPIRSAQKPSINQNNPSASYGTFKSFLERKQYGQQSMLKRALTRRAEWKNQLGNHQRMGFWGFFSDQYGINGRYFGVLFVLGLLGLFEFARRRPKVGLPFILMVILGTLFLVWYMNFADGTRQDPISGEGHIEVRDRDYFFTPGFVLFGMAIGFGVAALMQMARESTWWKHKSLRTPTAILLSLLIMLAAVPVKANYFYCDRSRNYIPYDFAHNLLNSCESNSILFIGGDNDTFPVWCLQEVYGIRLDVTPVNLALSNTTWYLKQVRDYMGIPLTWNDPEIDALRHRISQDRQMYRIQDQVLEEILNVNQWERPVSFALTVGSDARRYRGRDLSNYLVMEGMVYRLHAGERPGAIDMEKTRDLFFNDFNFRSLSDTTIHKDDRTRSLTGNYTTVLVLMADSLRRAKAFDEAIELTRKAIELVPFEYQTYNYLAQLYVDAGYEDSIPGLIDRVPPDRVKDIYFIWGVTNKYNNNREKAKNILRKTLDLYPTYKDAFREYTLLLYEDKEMDVLQLAIRTWLTHNPGDDETRKVMQELFSMPQTTTPPPNR
jgi:tetratricopeptide (TPR) repeat protein